MPSASSSRHLPMPVRVGDLEREACAVALIGHHLQGRLSADEAERRQRLAMEAVHADDLRMLLRDLPDPIPLAQERRRKSLRRPRIHLRPVSALAPAVPLIGVAAFAQWFWEYSAEGPFWAAAFAGVVGYGGHAVKTRLGQRHQGPAADR